MQGRTHDFVVGVVGDTFYSKKRKRSKNFEKFPLRTQKAMVVGAIVGTQREPPLITPYLLQKLDLDSI